MCKNGHRHVTFRLVIQMTSGTHHLDHPLKRSMRILKLTAGCKKSAMYLESMEHQES